MLKVLYEDNHIIVVVKPQNIPVQPDESGDLSLLDIVKNYIKIKYNKPGNVFAGLVHRLDRPVGGVMVFARTSKGAARLAESMKSHETEKLYIAVLKGCLDKPEGRLENYLFKDRKTNISSVVDPNTPGAKYASLDYKLISVQNKLNLVSINLHTGRPHQIRLQFSNIGCPVLGDVKYGKADKSYKGNIALFANSLSFPHPITKEILKFKEPLPDGFPWKS